LVSVLGMMSGMTLRLQMIVLGLVCFLFGLLSLARIAVDVKGANHNLPSLFMLCSIVYMYNMIGWVLFPTLAFNIFACMMIYRFGKSDSSSDPASLPVVDVFARGGLLLFIARFHPSELADCFTYLIGDHYNIMLSSTNFMQVLGSVHLFALVISLLYHGLKCHEGRHLAILHEMCSLLVIFWCMPPALSIVIYMTVFHGSRRLAWLSRLSTASGKGGEQMKLAWRTVALMLLVFIDDKRLSFTMQNVAADFFHTARFSGSAGMTCSKMLVIWLSSTTMLYIILSGKYRHQLSKTSQAELPISSRSD